MFFCKRKTYFRHIMLFSHKKKKSCFDILYVACLFPDTTQNRKSFRNRDLFARKGVISSKQARPLHSPRLMPNNVFAKRRHTLEQAFFITGVHESMLVTLTRGHGHTPGIPKLPYEHFPFPHRKQHANNKPVQERRGGGSFVFDFHFFLIFRRMGIK